MQVIRRGCSSTQASAESESVGEACDPLSALPPPRLRAQAMSRVSPASRHDTCGLLGCDSGVDRMHASDTLTASSVCSLDLANRNLLCQKVSSPSGRTSLNISFCSCSPPLSSFCSAYDLLFTLLCAHSRPWYTYIYI